MTSIGFIIDNLSYNWSIITYRYSNKNLMKVFITENFNKLSTIKINFQLQHIKSLIADSSCANTLLSV